LVLGYALHQGATAEIARTCSFSTLVVGNLSLILVNRSWRYSILRTITISNPALWWVIVGALAFLSLALTLPLLRGIFHFSAISVQQFLLSAALGLLSVLWFEVYKKFWLSKRT
jgi:Ca2+-transporting ATPase